MRRRILGAAVALAACAEHHTLTRVDDSGLSRLDEQQMQPVDDARVDEGRAQDAVAKAKAAEADARARLEVAKSEKDVSEAQLKRSIAERDLLKKQYAPKDQVAQAEENIEAAQDLVKATEFKLAYLNQMIGVTEAERKATDAHLATAHAVTERAKYRAMRSAHAPQAEVVDAGDLDRQVAEARAAEAAARKAAAEHRSKAVELYDKWQAADAGARTMARPESLTVPPPASEPSK